ncbi:Calcium uptake protein 3, mitochondrial [Bagarius yarrelli]|uniref:Calcium uptake protein 3, mitochondrial n=1 Tax=Bagarius yarrelli TaxID=175774 RepID=A0A556UY41_BAGYA|nr:Calcium uptake protein 3, mitochondrial [Bagarius yarrelli]
MAAAAHRFSTLVNTISACRNGAGVNLCTVVSSKWKHSTRRVLKGLCIAVGGMAVCQHCLIKTDTTRMIHAVPVVFAGEKTKISAAEDMTMSAHEHRFRLFSSVEYEGQLYMTPLDFIESVTMSEPKKKKFWRALKKKDLDKLLSDTPPVWKGSSRLFRNLNEKEPQAGFKIAFNMFDADGNEMVDKREFMVAIKTEQEKFGPRSFWDVLKHGARIVLFSDLVEHVQENLADTTLLVHFFGKKGKTELNFEDFYRFMDNLQTEVLEIEFLAYSKGMTTISEDDFARILLRYTTVDNISSYLENVHQSMPDEKGITFEEFRSFFQFLNNLEDFAIAMQMYNFASRPIGQDEFTRAVYVATGLKLSQHLVNIVFKIFDVDHDDQLSYKEFIGIMKDRLHRGSWGWGRGGQGGHLFSGAFIQLPLFPATASPSYASDTRLRWTGQNKTLLSVEVMPSQCEG